MRKAAIACFAVLDYTKQRILVECSQVVEEEKTDMIFGEKTEEQKRVAELTREVKELRKELLGGKGICTVAICNELKVLRQFF